MTKYDDDQLHEFARLQGELEGDHELKERYDRAAKQEELAETLAKRIRDQIEVFANAHRVSPKDRALDRYVLTRALEIVGNSEIPHVERHQGPGVKRYA